MWRVLLEWVRAPGSYAWARRRASCRAPCAEGSRTGLPLHATARPMLPIQPAALHWARAPRQPGPLARRRVARPWTRRARTGAGVGRALRARRLLLERHGVNRNSSAFAEAAQRRARCPQGEPSAMLPAVSAALAEWSPEGHWAASERSMQPQPRASERSMQPQPVPRSGRCSRNPPKRNQRLRGGLPRRPPISEARFFSSATFASNCGS